MEEKFKLSVPTNEGQNVVGEEELKTLGDGVMRSGGGSDGSGDGSDNGGDDGSGSGTPGSDYTPLYGSISDSITFGDMDWNCSGSIACYAKAKKIPGSKTDYDTDYVPEVQSTTGSYTISGTEKSIRENGKDYVLVGSSSAGSYYSSSIIYAEINFTNINLHISKYRITEEGGREFVSSNSYTVTVSVSAKLVIMSPPRRVEIEETSISISQNN